MTQASTKPFLFNGVHQLPDFYERFFSSRDSKSPQNKCWTCPTVSPPPLAPPPGYVQQTAGLRPGVELGSNWEEVCKSQEKSICPLEDRKSETLTWAEPG